MGARSGAYIGAIGMAVICGLSPSANATDYYIDPSGKGGLGNGTRTYTTPQAAFDATLGIPAGTAANPTRVLVTAGSYTGQVTISKDYVDVIGLGSDNSKTVFTDNLTLSFANATTTINANHFTASNMTFENSNPNGDGTNGTTLGRPTVQALAISSSGDENAFQNCSFNGFQDTLYNTKGRYYYNNCTITGVTDFIYGDATAVFDHSNIVVPSSYGGFITASRTAADKPIGFVIMNSTITGQSTGKDTFGRPWAYSGNSSTNPPTQGSYANVMFVNDKVGPLLKTSGTNAVWNSWDTTNTNLAGDSRYATYGLTDLNGNPLSLPSLAYNHALTANDASQLTLAKIFGPVSNYDFSHWGVGANTMWGPVNAAGTSNVQVAITTTAFTNYALGGTWDPSIQLATVPEPTCVAVLGGAALMLGRRKSRKAV